MPEAAQEKSTRRRQIVDALIEVFKRKGYDGASLNDLSAATGLAKASLYHRYPGGKAEMGRVALMASGQRFVRLVLAPLQRADPAADRLLAMLEGVEAFYRPGYPACLMNTLTLGEGGTLFGTDIRITIDLWAGLVAQAYEELGMDNAAARQQGSALVCGIQGALVIGRLQDREQLRQLLGQVRRDVAQLAA